MTVKRFIMSYVLHFKKIGRDNMSRTGITFNDVQEAIAELQGKQKNPTVDNIRAILGTGSKSTIARFLREWKSQHGLCNEDNGRLPSDLLGIVNGLWDALCSKAEAQIDGYRQEFDARITPIQQQLIQAKQLEASLRQHIHTLEEQFHQQKEEAQQLKARLVTEGQEKIRITERAAALENRRQEYQTENQRLHQLLKQVQENLEHYQASTQQLRQEQSFFMEKQQNEYEQKLSLLLAQVNTAISEKSACQAQHDQLTKAHESLAMEHKALITQFGGIHNQHEFLKIAHNKIQQDYDAVNGQNQEKIDALSALQHTVVELKLNIKLKDEKIASLEEAVGKGNNKIETLRHETQFALQEKATLEGQLKQIQAMVSSDKIQTMNKVRYE